MTILGILKAQGDYIIFPFLRNPLDIYVDAFYEFMFMGRTDLSRIAKARVHILPTRKKYL